MTDRPIAFTAEGRPLFDNTPTVVCVLLKHDKGLVVVRRANDPGRGLLGLPGGYHMRGESWQEAGAREVWEETGYNIDPLNLRQVGEAVTDEYGNNLIIAQYAGRFSADPFSDRDGEVEEVLLLQERGRPSDWAFPRHYQAARSIVF